MVTIQVHTVVGEVALEVALQRLRDGKTPAGVDRGAANVIEDVLVAKPTSGPDTAEYTIIYTTDMAP